MTSVDEESDFKYAEPERKRKKTEDSSSGNSVEVDASEDFLILKPGFFCAVCSLFCSGERAMTNHCKSTRHKKNTEKFMAKQRKEKEQNEVEERSSSSR